MLVASVELFSRAISIVVIIIIISSSIIIIIIMEEEKLITNKESINQSNKKIKK